MITPASGVGLRNVRDSREMIATNAQSVSNAQPVAHAQKDGQRRSTVSVRRITIPRASASSSRLSEVLPMADTPDPFPKTRLSHAEEPMRRDSFRSRSHARTCRHTDADRCVWLRHTMPLPVDLRCMVSHVDLPANP